MENAFANILTPSSPTGQSSGAPSSNAFTGLLTGGAKSAPSPSAPTPGGSPAVSQAVDKVAGNLKEPSLIQKFWNNFTSDNSSLREHLNQGGFFGDKGPKEITKEGITAPAVAPDKGALQARLIEGPTKEDITQQHNDLFKLKDTLDANNPESIQGFNTKINKLNSDIEQYNKVQKAHQVISTPTGEGSLGPTLEQQFERGITLAGLSAILPELGGVIAGADAAGIALGPTLLKYATNAAIGVPAFQAIDTALQRAKENSSDQGKMLIFMGELFATGGLLHGINETAPKLGDKLFQTISEKYNAPKTVYFNPEQVKDIYKTGKLLTPDEQKAFAEATGSDRDKIKNAFNNGISIELPASKIKNVSELPFWTKIKSAFGIEPATGETVKVGGKAKETVRGFLPERTGGQMSPENLKTIAEQIKTKNVRPFAEPSPEGIEKTPNLRTFDFSEKEGEPQTPEENAKIHNQIINHPEEPMTPGGESFSQAVNRQDSALKQIKNSPEVKSGKNVGVMTHNSMYGLIKLQDENGWPTAIDKDFREAYTKQDNTNPTGDSYVIKGKNGEGDIILMRHGETEDNAAKLFRRAEAKLTDKGIDQAKELADNVKKYNITKIYSSDLPRAVETSKIVLGDKEEQAPSKTKLQKAVEGRKTLPEVPAQPKRVTEYTERLKLRGVDPVLVNAIITPSGKSAYGVSVGGNIGLEKVVEQFTEDHEIFHQIWQNFEKMRLFKGFDKEALLTEARALYGDLPPAQLEEELARDFQQYVNNQESGKASSFFGKIREFFEKLLASFKRLFRNQKDIEEFYRTIREEKATEEINIPRDEKLQKFIDDAKTKGTLDFRKEQFSVGKFLEKTPIDEVFNDEGDLTLKTLTKLEGRSTVSKQFIEDLTNSGDIKQQERDLIRAMLETEPEKVNVPQFAQRVKDELLPLTSESTSGSPKGRNAMSFYENISLPDNIKGNVANYFETIYSSPIQTSAGRTHFGGRGGLNSENYFGHTRIEDMGSSVDDFNVKTLEEGLGKNYYQGRQNRIAKRSELDEAKKKQSELNSTRRVIEVQSDLYQKGNLEREKARPLYDESSVLYSNNQKYGQLGYETVDLNERNAEVAKLEQYNNPSAHFRMVREEVRKAAQDGKTKLQFPTGETAMKIEGLGDNSQWMTGTGMSSSDVTPETTKVGQEIYQGHDDWVSGNNGWIITDVLGDGKFKAISKDNLQRALDEAGDPNLSIKDALQSRSSVGINNFTEEFDISGKVDTNNPIYRFYEKDLGRYLKNNYDAKPIIDDKGVTWMEVNVDPEYADLPVPAFNEKSEEKNPVFDSGDKLKDVQDTLDFVEKRVGAKKVEIGKIQNQLNRELMSLEAAKEMPEAHKKAYGEDRVPKYEAKINELQGKIKDADKEIQEIKNEYKPSELEKKVEDLKPSINAPKIRVSGKDIELPEELFNRQLEYQFKKEALADNPLSTLKKYEATAGEFKGRLPEAGQGSTRYKTNKAGVSKPVMPHHGNALANEFATRGDTLFDSMEFARFAGPDGKIDSETIRSEYEKFKAEKEKVKKEGIEIRKDIAQYILKEKDKIALERIAKSQNAELEKDQIKTENMQEKAREADSLQDWKNFVATYTKEQSLPKSLDEVVPPIVRGGLQAPILDLLKAKDKGWNARESLDRNIEKAFSREDAIKLNEFLSDHLRENATREVEYKDQRFKELNKKMKELGIRSGSDESAFAQLYGEGLVTTEDLKREFPQNWENVQKAVPIFQKMYDTMINDWNSMRTDFNYPDVPKLKNFFPHFQGLSFWTKYYGILNKFDDLPTAIAGKTEFFQPGKTFTRHELHRTGRQTTYDAIGGAKEYINSVAKQMFTMDSLARANALDKYITKSDEVGQRLGTPLKLSRFQTNLQEVKRNQLASKMGGMDREIEKFGDRKVVNTALTLSKLIGKNIIAFNPAAVLGHGVSITVNAATVGKAAFAKGLLETARSPFSNEPYWMIDGQKSDLLFRRTPKEYLKTRLETVEEAGGWMIKQMDIFKTKLSISSKYYELINKGVAPEVAIKQADIYGAHIVGDYSRGLKPIILNQKLMKLVAQFQFGMNDALSVLLHDIPYENKKVDGETIKMYQGKDGVYREKSDYIKMFWKYAQWMVYAYLLNIVYKKIKGSGKGLSPLDLIFTLTGAEPTYDMTFPYIHLDTTGQSTPLGARASQTAKDLFSELPFVGSFTGNNPLGTALNNITKDAMAGNLLKAGEGVLSSFISPVGGGNQVKKTLEGISAYKQGFVTSKSGIPIYTVPHSIPSLFQAIVFGPSATPAAQAYYGNIGKPSPGKATFDQIQSLLAEGKTEEANAITAAMTPKEYGTYKAEKTRAAEIKAIPEANKILQLVRDGKVDEANKITGAMTPEEYKIYTGAKKMILKATSATPENNDNGIATFEGHTTYYKGAKAPDISTITSGNPDDGQIKGYNPNGEPIYARDTKLEASRRKELIKQDPYWSVTQSQYDHIVPLESGGTNTASNIMLISTAADKGNQAFEDYLGGLYRTGKISRADAVKASIDYKINKTVSLDDVISGKY